MQKVVAFYPCLRDPDSQQKILARFTWYLWPWRGQIGGIRVWIPVLPKSVNAARNNFDPAIDRQFADLGALFIPEPDADDRGALQALINNPCDLLFVWRAPQTAQERTALALLRERFEICGGQIHVVDPAYSPAEPTLLLRACLNAFGDETTLIAESRQKFDLLRARVRNDAVKVMDAWPQANAQAGRPDAHTIISGEMLLDTRIDGTFALLAIAADDPALHAGCSRQAAVLRTKLYEAMERSGAYLVTPIRDYAVHVAQCPPSLRERVIGIPYASDRSMFRFDLASRFMVTQGSSALVSLMLPLAGALSKHITIYTAGAGAVCENSVAATHPAYARTLSERRASVAQELIAARETLTRSGKTVKVLPGGSERTVHVDGYGAQYRPSLPSLIWQQLFHARRVQALLAFAAVCVAFAYSRSPLVTPIASHLEALSGLAVIGAAITILGRFFMTRAASAYTALAAQSGAAADLAATIAAVLAGRGVVRRFASTLAGVAIVAWLGAYALRLYGNLSQRSLDAIFWYGLAAVLGGAAFAYGLQIAFHWSKRIGARWREHLRSEFAHQLTLVNAPTAAALADLDDRLGRLFVQTATVQAGLVKQRDAIAQLGQLGADRAERTGVDNQDIRDTLHTVHTATNVALAGLNSSLVELVELNNALTSSLRTLETRVEGADTKAAAALEAMRSELDPLRLKVDALPPEFDALNAKLNMLHSNMDALPPELDALNAKLNMLHSNMDALPPELDALNAKANVLQSKLDALPPQLEALNAKLNVLQSKLDALPPELQSLRPELETLVLGLRADIQEVARIGSSSMAAGSEALAAKIENTKTELASRLDQVQADATTAQKAVAKADAVKAAADQLDKRVKSIVEDVRTLSTGGYQSFARHVPRSELQELGSLLSSTLRVNLTGHNLGYMAMKTRELEMQSLGRFAAPVSDVLVRTAALLACDVKKPRVLEIGTLFGIAAAAMWKNAQPHFKRVRLTLLDPLNGYYGEDYVPTMSDIITGVPVVRDTLEHNLRVAGIPETDVEIIQNLSQAPEAIEAVSRHRYDLLVIDGDHSYEGVRRDYINYAPLVRRRGFIIFDDYGVDIWQGVTDFVDDLMAEEPNLERVVQHGRTLICRVTGRLAAKTPRVRRQPTSQNLPTTPRPG